MNGLLYQKIKGSRQTTSASETKAYLSQKVNYGTSRTFRLSRSQVYALRSTKSNLRIGGYYYFKYPYAEAAALKWGTKVESLNQYLYFRSGGLTRSGVVGLIGLRNGEKTYVKAAIGVSHGINLQRYKKIRYRSCRRVLFWKKCRTKTKWVKRGLYTSEVVRLRRIMMALAYANALKKVSSRLNMTIADEIMPTSTFTEESDAATFYLRGGKEARNKVFGVEYKNLVPSTGAMLRGTMSPTLARNVKRYALTKTSFTLNHRSSAGKFKLTFSKSTNVWNIYVKRM